MITLGFNILGNLNKPATSQAALGLPFWRIVIASGILTSIMGFMNLIATFFFSDSKHGITGRQVRSQGAALPKSPPSTSSSHSKAFSLSPSSSVHRAPSPVLPSYNAPQQSAPEERRRSLFGMKLPVRLSQMQISKPFHASPEQFEKFANRSSPVVPDVQRPPTALHPYHNVGRNDAPQVPRYPASSRYSVDSTITRF